VMAGHALPWRGWGWLETEPGSRERPSLGPADSVIQAILPGMAQAQFLPERRYAARLGMLLALALILAQTGAVMHGYSHLRASGESPGVPATSSQSCPDCLSFAPVLAPAGGTSHSLTVAQAQIGTTYRTLVAPLVGHSPQHAFLSRAPPFLA
jgi:hypothetical protein